MTDRSELLTEASLFSENNQLLMNDTKFFLSNYLSLIEWREKGGDCSVDISCTTGDVISQLLLPVVPESTGKIVGLDMSQEMIDFAKQKWQHPKVSFEVFDFASSEIPPEYEEAFDHVFSFYGLHNIWDQKQAFTKIWRMLKTGGDCFLTMLVSNPIFDVIDSMPTRFPKWGDYMKDAYNFISPYSTLLNPKRRVRRLLTEIGFVCKVCHFIERTFVFSSLQHFKDFAMSTNVFLKHIPVNLRNEYLEDYMKLAESFGIALNEEGTVPYVHQVMVVVARRCY